MTDNFDLEQAIKAFQAGKDLTGKDGFLTPLIKQITEAALKAELEQHLEDDEQPNRKNGSSKKTVKSSVGSFEPKLVKKNQTKLTEEIDRKILSMFSLGMSYRDIRGHVEDVYGLAVSGAAITNITDRLILDSKNGGSGHRMPFVHLYGSMLTDLHNRGLIACVDSLTGFRRGYRDNLPRN